MPFFDLKVEWMTVQIFKRTRLSNLLKHEAVLGGGLFGSSKSSFLVGLSSLSQAVYPILAFKNSAEVRGEKKGYPEKGKGAQVSEGERERGNSKSLQNPTPFFLFSTPFLQSPSPNPSQHSLHFHLHPPQSSSSHPLSPLAAIEPHSSTAQSITLCVSQFRW